MEALEFLVGGEHVEPFVRRLEADIDDVGAVTDEFLVDVSGRLAGVVIDARVVGGLLADVQHAHNAGRVVVTDPQPRSVDVVHIRPEKQRLK